MSKQRSHAKSRRGSQVMARLLSQSAAYNQMIAEFKVLRAEWEKTHQDVIIMRERKIYTVFNNKRLLAEPHISKETKDYLMRKGLPRVEEKNLDGEVALRIY